MVRFLLLIFSLLLSTILSAQSTSWTGENSTRWNRSNNWTNGVPNQNKDAIIGDANFTGSKQPDVNSNGKCRNLTIGNGAKVCELEMSRHLTVYGDLYIGTNGTILADRSKTITLRGNWTNNGFYNPTNNSARVTFSGANQLISGETTFKKVQTNAGSHITLADDITIDNEIIIQGIFDPTLDYQLKGSGDIEIRHNSELKVLTQNFDDNYPISGSFLVYANSNINYASSIITQRISPYFYYGKLTISGGSTKILTADLPNFQTWSGAGRLQLEAGILDTKGYEINRGAGSGGNLLLAAGTTLRIGGSESLPGNFNNKTIASTSTVEYYGTNQVVGLANYGNLILSASSGNVVKTMPNSAMIIYGQFEANKGDGTQLTTAANGQIDFKKNFTLGSGVVFNSGSNTLIFRGSWRNDGSYLSVASNSKFRGVGEELSGNGTTAFHNVDFRANNITCVGNMDLTASGDFKTSSGGDFEHNDGGLITLTGTNKQISGHGLVFNDLSVSGSYSNTQFYKIKGDLQCTGALNNSIGKVTFLGESNSITGNGTLSFHHIDVLGNISVNKDFSISRNVYVSPSGSLTASAGQTTFKGGSTLSGKAHLYDVVINSNKNLNLGTDSELGIAGSFTRNGTLNTNAYKPNTVRYNGSGNQDVINATYNKLVFSNAGTKTATGDFTTTQSLTIDSSVTFDAANKTITNNRHWYNNGTFTASTSTVIFNTGNLTNIHGETTFNNLTSNKNSNQVYVILNDDVTARDIVMTKGRMSTGTNSISTTGTRTGQGYIYGTIIHDHAIAADTPYYFESAYNAITFSNPIGVDEVSVFVEVNEVEDFDPEIECIRRQYEIDVPNGTYTNATVRLHYLGNELNALEEPHLHFYEFDSGILWNDLGFTTRNQGQNWVELVGITNISNRYTLSGTRKVMEWTGAVSSAWENAANWAVVSGSDQNSRVPNNSDAVKIGNIVFNHQPTISNPQTVANIRLYSAKEVTLTLNNNLTTLGYFKGRWDEDRTHTIDVGSNELQTGGDLKLGNGNNSRYLKLVVGTGTVSVSGDLIQRNGSVITFTDAGTLNLKRHYLFYGGIFNRGTSTVQYLGDETQVVAGVDYHNLTFAKNLEQAFLFENTTVYNDFTTTTGGEIVLNNELEVKGDITIGANTTVINENQNLQLKGDWINAGTYSVNSGTITINGTEDQFINASSFNDIDINKPSGNVKLGGNLDVHGSLDLIDGILDLDTYTINRNSQGGFFKMNYGTELIVSGTDNFPDNYATDSLDITAHVWYDGTIEQNIRPHIAYPILTLMNGESNVKKASADFEVKGLFTIKHDATLQADTMNIILNGDFVNDGTINPGKSTLILNGVDKTFSGPLNLNNLIVQGDYEAVQGKTTIQGNMFIETGGVLDFSDHDAILDGDMTNKGSLISNAISTFTGTREQNLQLLNAISSNSTGVINFNGTVSPVVSSTSSPNYATVNINNTGGVSASTPWNIFGAMNIASGASFNAGPLNHTFHGHFTNNGSIMSSGRLDFTPGVFVSTGNIKLNDGGASVFESTGTVNFGGSGELTITCDDPTFYDVVISNTHANGVHAQSDWTINELLEIEEGATFHAGADLTHTLKHRLLVNGELDAETSTMVFDGTDITINGAGFIEFNSVEVALGADVTLQKAIRINADLTNDGDFITDGQSVSFTGGRDSEIKGDAGDVTLANLVQDKTSGAKTILSIPVYIREELNLISGVINTSQSSLLIVQNDAIASSGNSSSYVDGPMQKIGDDAFVFPVGNDGKWARLGISAPASETNAYVAEFYNEPYADTTSMLSLLGIGLHNVSRHGYWELDRTSGLSPVRVELFWQNAQNEGIFDGGSDLVVAHWNDFWDAWESEGQSSINDNFSGSVTSDLVTTFSPFTFGSLSRWVNPLPIELMSFDAKEYGDLVKIDWVTASEINNEYFIVERSSNTEDWKSIATIDGAGTSNTQLSYSQIDADPLNGVSYYRLKQVDYDGAFTYSEIRTVDRTSVLTNELSLYPNPTRNHFKLVGQGIDIEEIRLFNQLGQDVSSRLRLTATFNNGFGFDCSQLPIGMYILKANTQTLRLIVK